MFVFLSSRPRSLNNHLHLQPVVAQTTKLIHILNELSFFLVSQESDCAVSCCIAPAVSVLCMELSWMQFVLSCLQHAQTRRCLPNHVCFLTDVPVFVSLSLSCLQLLYPILGIFWLSTSIPNALHFVCYS